MDKTYSAREVRIVSLREMPLPADMTAVSSPDEVYAYFNACIKDSPQFNPFVENFIVLMLNTRKRVICHSIVSMGTLDTLLVHPREVFRAAIVCNASAIVLMHNHPSGESTPSEADIKCTRDLIRAGHCLKIEVIDHVIAGNGQRTSLKELGYFYS
mgnify:CR=1 FL=1